MSRTLLPDERRLVVEALRRAAEKALRTKADAIEAMQTGAIPATFAPSDVRAYIDTLAGRAQLADRLASEIAAGEISIERTRS